MSKAYGYRRLPKKSVDSRGSCVGMLSIEHTRTPGPLKLKSKIHHLLIHIYILLDHRKGYLFISLFLSASYRQKGVSMVVHSFINSMDPPGSAEISQMASIRCGSAGAPTQKWVILRKQGKIARANGPYLLKLKATERRQAGAGISRRGWSAASENSQPNIFHWLWRRQTALSVGKCYKVL